MSKAFNDWLESLDLKLEENVILNMAYISGRADQREADASLVERNKSWKHELVAMAIREQKIDD